MTRREANETALCAADYQRKWRVVVEMLAAEVEQSQDAHWKATLRVARHRLAAAEDGVRAADEALREIASRDARTAASWDANEGRWPGAAPAAP